jgi:hypothetical protein
MLGELVNRLPNLSPSAKVIVGVWLAQLPPDGPLEMSVKEAARRSGRVDRGNTSRVIAEIEKVLGKGGLEWLRIERRRNLGQGYQSLLISWPILNQPENLVELHRQLMKPTPMCQSRHKAAVHPIYRPRVMIVSKRTHGSCPHRHIG